MAIARLISVSPATANVYSISQSTSSQTFLGSNSARKGAIIYNSIKAGLLYVKLGSAASTTDFSFILLPFSAFTLPYPAYTGVITGVWSISGTGDAKVTELLSA